MAERTQKYRLRTRVRNTMICRTSPKISSNSVPDEITNKQVFVQDNGPLSSLCSCLAYVKLTLVPVLNRLESFDRPQSYDGAVR